MTPQDQADRDREAAEAFIEGLQHERQAAKDLKFCGHSEELGDTKSGCGEKFVWLGAFYRCLDCGVAYCKRCLKKHCEHDLEAAKAETDSLKERIVILQACIEDQLEAANLIRELQAEKARHAEEVRELVEAVEYAIAVLQDDRPSCIRLKVALNKFKGDRRE